jgi:peptide/nickel transport system permease protein
MAITEAHKSLAKAMRYQSVVRIGMYLLRRVVTIGIAVVIGILLTIIIANWGGHLDEVKKAAARDSVEEYIMADDELRLMPWEDRMRLEEKLLALEIRRLGLDRPFWVRTPGYLIGALTLDLGWARDMTSPSGSRRVRLIILERIPATLVLFGTADLILFFSVLLISLFLSRRYGGKLDRAIIALAPTSAAPGWFYGLFLILIFAALIPILPFGGMVAAPPPTTTLGYALSLMRHMVLPVLAIIIGAIFASIYSSRTFFLIFSSEDYVEMAKARGLPSGMIERRHILRPTLPPILWGFMMMMITLWMGSIILETIFAWPGLGSLLFEAVSIGETAVIIGSTIIYAYLLAATLLVMDLIFMLVDPRVKVGVKKGGVA